ncbi:MAG: hypothetical protein DRJ47_05100 [Thermoprotei archaeon]|nr:MAG: hypothetical protein DRJ47_05100 [Thermoprotei archaeon]
MGMFSALKGVKIRALTWHYEPSGGKLKVSEPPQDFFEFASFLEKEGLQVWSKRIILPTVHEIEYSGLEKLVSEAVEIVEDNGIDYLALHIGSCKLWNAAVGLLNTYEKLFISIGFNPEKAKEIYTLLHTVSKKCGVEAGARFGVSFGPPPISPYFPITQSIEEGVSISLLYPSYLMYSLTRSNGISTALRKLAVAMVDGYKSFRRHFNATIKFLGVDYSLSPWENESVAELLEKAANIRLGEPGSLHIVHVFNRLIREVAESFQGTGFNEVMLPLAEDNRLKVLAMEGALSLQKLVSLVSVCTAGLDMVPLPRNTPYKVVVNLMMDLHALSKVKGKTVGLRILLPDAEAGEILNLGFFGPTPVLSPYE